MVSSSVLPFSDPCASNPCQNGGTCSTNKKGKVKCSCMLGFTGPFCPREVHTIRGNVTITNPKYKGSPLDTSDPDVQRDLQNMTSPLALNLSNTIEPELTKKFNSTRGNIKEVKISSFRVGSLIVDFTITYTNEVNESLTSLEQAYLQSLNGSLIGSVAKVRLTDFDECATGLYCGANSICANTATSFKCTCASGYTGDGITCTKKPTENEYRILAITLSICLLILLLLIFLLIFLARRRRRTKKENITELHFLESVNWRHNPTMRAKVPNNLEDTFSKEGEFRKIPLDYFYNVSSQ